MSSCNCLRPGNVDSMTLRPNMRTHYSDNPSQVDLFLGNPNKAESRPKLPNQGFGSCCSVLGSGHTSSRSSWAPGLPSQAWPSRKSRACSRLSCRKIGREYGPLRGPVTESIWLPLMGLSILRVRASGDDFSKVLRNPNLGCLLEAWRY